MKIALVTGVTSGFGRAITERLIAEGYHVIGTGRRQVKLQELASQYPQKFIPLNFDIQDLSATQQAWQSLPAELKNIDLLVNNAGLALGLEGADKAQLSDWEQMIDTNIKGLLFITRLVLPEMVAKNAGHIINIGSIAGTYPYPGGNVYGATKAFVKQFSLNLRADLAGTNIRVANVEPGLCGDTDFSLVRFKGDEDKVKKVYENVAYIKPENIAEIVAWISKQPPHVNINSIEVMPTAQSFAGLSVTRT